VDSQPSVKNFEISHAKSNERNEPNVIFNDAILLRQKEQNLIKKIKTQQKHRDYQ
jgi:hypothetical protein